MGYRAAIAPVITGRGKYTTRDASYCPDNLKRSALFISTPLEVGLYVKMF